MRRLVVALLVAALALTLAGCGGGGNEQASQDTTAQQTAPPPAAPAATAGDDSLIADRSPTETAAYVPISTQATSLPVEIQKRIDKKQPMLIYVFDRTQRASAATRVEVDAAMKSYRGLIDLVTYDASRYVKTDPVTGAVTVDPKLSADAEASKVATTIERLKIASTPAILVVDSSGNVTWRSRGFTDRQLIQKEILKATE